MSLPRLSPLDKYCLETLRTARFAALQDAEAFAEVCVALERVGASLGGASKGLWRDKEIYRNLASGSPAAADLSPLQRQCHCGFDELFELVRVARNDALHQGAVARHATRHAVELCLMMEDSLMSRTALVGDFMVRDPVCAALWQPLSLIRQQMLANSFSFLPVQLSDGQWGLVADLAVAKAVPRTLSSDGRRKALAATLQAAMQQNRLAVPLAATVGPDASLGEAMATFNGLPLLVVEGTDLRGIVTPFDLL